MRGAPGGLADWSAATHENTHPGGASCSRCSSFPCCISAASTTSPPSRSSRFAATYEVAHVITRKGFRPLVFPVYVFSLAYPFVYHFFGLTVLVIFYLFAIITSICCSVFNGSLDASIAVGTLLLYVYPLALLMCMLLVYMQFDRPHRPDGGLHGLCRAVVRGHVRLLRRHVLWQAQAVRAHQPQKDGGGRGVRAAGGAWRSPLVLIPLQRVWESSISSGVLLTLGVLCGTFGQIGDLFASIIKRWADVKDFSSVFPGHGGMMDRIDSILLCAPIVLCTFTILQIFGIY